MLEIPFLKKFVENAVKKQQIADSVDLLNYYISASLLGFFALGTSAKQYFGTPIQCWTPSDFTDGWNGYAEDYCFITSSYHLPFDASIEHGVKTEKDHFSYYRWVPVVLAIQATCFYLPNCLWSIMHQRSRINPLALLKEAEKVSKLSGEKREEEITKLADFYMDAVSSFSSAYSSRGRVTRWSGMNASLMYLAVKVLYLVNIYAQVVLLNIFLAKGYLNWGYQSVLNTLGTSSWEESEVFPKVIMCDLPVRRLGNLQTYSLQCVIMMNAVYEKIYLFLYIWLFILGVITLINFCFYLAILLVPRLRTTVTMWHMDERKMSLLGCNRGNIAHLVEEYLHPDGVMLLMFLSDRVSGRLSYDLTNKILTAFMESPSVCGSSITKACSTLQRKDSLSRYQSSLAKNPLVLSDGNGNDAQL